MRGLPARRGHLEASLCVTMWLLGATQVAAASEVRDDSSAGSSPPSVQQFLTRDGRFDFQSARRSRYRGALDLRGFAVRLDPRTGNPVFEAEGAFADPPDSPRSLPAHSSPEDFKWATGFGRPGFDGRVTALAIYDSSLIAGGDFVLSETTAVQHIARWDGTRWQPLGVGLSGGAPSPSQLPVAALGVFQGELVAAGEFTRAGDTAANHVASWNGKTWRPLGTGLRDPDDLIVGALLVVDGGLLVGGHFTQAGDSLVSNVARWDGFAWHPVGAGLHGLVSALAVYDGAVVAGGILGEALFSDNVMRWNGSAWEPLGLGEEYGVFALTVFHGELVVGGRFTTAGGTPAAYIARWDGSAWKPLGAGLSGPYAGGVSALSVWNGALIAGGSFAQAGGIPAEGLASWDGTNWSPMDSGVSSHDGGYGQVRALVVQDSSLVVGGAFSRAGDVAVSNVVRREGASWHALGTGGAGFDGPIFASALYAGDLVVGGNFSQAGETFVNGIARWNGSTWLPCGAGVTGDGGASVGALVVHGTDLVVGGSFQQAGGVPASNIASWNGTDWQPLGDGFDDAVYALCRYDDEIVAGGTFTHSGATLVAGLARWNGIEWQSMGSGIAAGPVFEPPYVACLTVFRGDLVAGGCWGAVDRDTTASSLARWDGTHWRSLGANLWDSRGNTVCALAVYDNALIVGGDFEAAGGVPASAIARWDGIHWSVLGGSMSLDAVGRFATVRALALYAGDLVATGDFDAAAGVPARHIARWNGSVWAPLGSGLGSDGLDLVTSGDDLWVGGWFGSAGAGQSARIALWRGTITPIAVQDFAAVIGPNGAHLGWRLSAAARREIESLRVQRAGSAAGPYADCASPPLSPALEMSFDDSGVAPGGALWYRLVVRSHAGDESVAGPIEAVAAGAGTGRTTLRVPIDAPRRGPIRIFYTLRGDRAEVILTIHDARGRLLRTLDAGVRDPGVGSVVWDRRDAAGASVARGIYLVQLRAGSERASAKLLVTHR